MLAYVLALAVGLGSAGLYAIAFTLPEIHRKNDIIWSGVGLFYALVLWVCASRISGGVLLGQIASVALLGWFAWQTLMLRREALPPNQQTPLPTQAEIKQKIQEQLDRLTKSQNPGDSSASGGTVAHLQQGLISVVDRVTATIEGIVANFKKTKTPAAKTPQATVKPSVVEPPAPAAVEAPVPVVEPPTPEATPVVEPPAPAAVEAPVPVVEPPAPAAVEAQAPVANMPPTQVESAATPVDFASPSEIETPSVADKLPNQEAQFQSPTDDQIEAAIRDAEADSK